MPEATIPLELRTVKKHRFEKAFTPRITQYTDARQNPVIGNMYGQTIIPSEKPVEWVKRSLENRGYVFGQEPQTEDQKFCDIELDINILSLRSMEGIKSADVVFTARNDDMKLEKVVRGRSTNILWVASKREYSGALKSALRIAIDELDQTLLDVCD